MIYEFGVMSQRYSLEAEAEDVAKTAMCLFYKKNIPIAIYLPKEKKQAFSPMLHLKFFQATEEKNKQVKLAYDTIKEVVNEPKG